MRGYSEKNSRFLKNQVPNVLKSVKSLKDLSPSKNGIEPTGGCPKTKTSTLSYNEYQTIHYVKILTGNLNSQLQLYDWRKSAQQDIIPIKDFKLVSQGNTRNPQALVKVTIAKSAKQQKTMKNMTLSKTISILEETLKTTQKLINKFGLFDFTEDKIWIAEDEERILIWPLSKVWINPSNCFYEKQERFGCQITEKQTVFTLLSIFSEKSLKTKLSVEFFQEMQTSQSIEELFQKMKDFQKKNSIFAPNKLKGSSYTLSTAIQKSSQCLQFSLKSSRKKISKCERPSSQMSPFRSLRTLFQINSLVIPRWQKKSQANYTCNIRSAEMLSPDTALKKSAGMMLNSGQNQQKYHQQASFVFSELFKDEEVTDTASPTLKVTALSKNSFASDNSWYDPREKKSNLQLPPKIPEQLQTSHDRSIKIDSTILTKSRNQLLCSQFLQNQIQPEQEEEEEEVQYKNPFDIILKNGWSNNFSGLTNSPTKQSFCDGTLEQNHFLRGFELNHLKKFGRDIGKSMMPVQEDSFEQY